jgi:hypothetical protein
MIIIGLLQSVLWLIFIPLVIGTLFADVDTKPGKILVMWISGQLTLWAVFQLSCVPFIIKEIDFKNFVRTYAAIVALLAAAAIIHCIGSYKKNRTKNMRCLKHTGIHVVSEESGTVTKIFWLIFAVLLLLQLVLSEVMTYADGDDAFYVAISTITDNADTMYRKLPYTGGSTGLDLRHGLAPFPIWIAFISRVSGIRPVTVAHVVLPLTLIPMGYAVLYFIAGKLLKKEKIPVFMVFAEILVMFGNYSYYTVENFMIARSRQGKAVLGSIVIPTLIWLMFLIMDNLKTVGKLRPLVWLLMFITLLAACLCSTLGTFICCVLTGISAVCMAFTFKKIKFFVPMALSCIPCIVYAAMYIIYR